MAAPIIGAVGLGSSLLGGITGAAGSLMQGSAQSKSYKYQAGVAQLNKQVALQNAEYSIRAGETQAQQSGMKTKFMVGKEKAAQGASGVDVNVGSTQQVRESQEQVGRMDQSIIRDNAGRRAYSYEVEATNYEAQSKADLAAAKTSKTAGYIGAFSSILGSATSVSSKWMQGQQAGLWGGSGGGSNPTDLGYSGYDQNSSWGG